MRGTTSRSTARGRSPRRAFERWVAAAMFALAVALAWGANHASAQSAPCPDALRGNTGLQLKQQVAATRAGPMGYYRFGSGEPLLLITGYRATISEWNAAFLQNLARHHEVIIVDNPGVGRSRADHVPETMAGMGDAISEFIETLGLRKVDVVGWSMGGMVAQQLALDHGYQVRSLVLLSTTPPGSGAEPVSSVVNNALSGQSPSSFEAIMGVLFPPDARDRAVQCFRAEMFVPPGYGYVSVQPRVAKAQSQAMFTWWNDDAAAKALARVKVPTLIIAGDKDEVLSPHNAKLLAKLMPRATLHLVTDGGHALMYQDPGQLASEISSFLNAHS